MALKIHEDSLPDWAVAWGLFNEAEPPTTILLATKATDSPACGAQCDCDWGSQHGVDLCVCAPTSAYTNQD